MYGYVSNVPHLGHYLEPFLIYHYTYSQHLIICTRICTSSAHITLPLSTGDFVSISTISGMHPNINTTTSTNTTSEFQKQKTKNFISFINTRDFTFLRALCPYLVVFYEGIKRCELKSYLFFGP